MEPPEDTDLEHGSIQDVTARLALWSSCAPKGFARVEYVSEFSHREVVEHLREELLALEIPLHTIELSAQKTPAEVIRELLQQLNALPLGVVSVSGFPTAFPHEVPFEDSLRVLNFSREVLAAFPLRQVWWMTPNFADEFIRAAPDLNSWFILRLNLTEANTYTSEEWTPRVFSHIHEVDKEDARKRATYLAGRLNEAINAKVSTKELIPLALDSLENLVEAGIDDHCYKRARRIGDLVMRRLEQRYRELLNNNFIPSEILSQERYYIASSLNRLGRLYSFMGLFIEAEPVFKRSLQIGKEVLGSNHLNTTTYMVNLANLLTDRGKYDEAEALYKQALKLDETNLSNDDIAIATDLNNLAGLYFGQKRLSEAEPLINRALKISEKIQGPDHPDFAIQLNNLAALYWNQGRYQEAEGLLKRALEIGAKTLGLEHPDMVFRMMNLADVYSDQGRFDEAEILYKDVLRLEEKLLGLEHPNTINAKGNLALLYSTQGRFNEAEPLLYQAIEIAQERLGPDNPITLRLMHNLFRMKEEMWSNMTTTPRNNKKN